MGSSITIAPEETYTSYLWHDGSTAPEFTTDQEGWVTLVVTDNNGCGARDSVYVTVYDLPVVDLGPDTPFVEMSGINIRCWIQMGMSFITGPQEKPIQEICSIYWRFRRDLGRGRGCKCLYIW